MAEIHPTPNNPQDNPAKESTLSATLHNDQPYKPADDTEQIYFQGPPALRGELGHLSIALLIAVVLFAIPTLVWIWKPGLLPVWAGLVMFLVAIICLLIPILITLNTHYRITNYRIDYERGVLTKRIDTLELWHVDDIQFYQSLLDRILRVGTITVISDDQTTPNLKLNSIPNPRPVFESLKQRIIAVKRQRGVIKMDIG